MSEIVAAPEPALAARHGFHDPATLVQALKILLVLPALLDLAATVSGLMEFNLLLGIANGTHDADVATLTSNDLRQQAIGIAQVGLFIVTGVLFLVWVHRANRNARALGATGLKFTPGWAVGWFFVPIVSFWKPFQAMREIWQASTAPGNWQAVETPPLLGLWWTVYLADMVLTQLGNHLAKAVDGVQSAMVASAFTTASDVSSLAVKVLTFLLVTRIAAAQTWQAKLTQVF
jgi:hypothetical protein